MNSQAATSKPERRCLVGVDGCHAGWIAATSREGEDAIQLEMWPTFADVLAAVERPAMVVVDIPIGLLDERRRGGRLCDQAARKLLGKRRSSVFNPPSRDALPCKTYNEARRFGLSQQGFAIVPKIREVDELMTAAMQDEILESHPELAFTGLAGAPMAFNKKKRAGREERLEALKLARELAPCRLLAQVDELLKTERERFSRRDVATDDIVDAYAMLNVAARIAAGVARRVPTAPPLDRRGLRMEMWY